MSPTLSKNYTAPGLLLQLKVERQKLRRRHVLLVPLGFLAFQCIYSLWLLQKADPAELANGYMMSVFQLTFLNEILVPIMTAVIASRICDMEIKGDTLKILYTLQKRSSFYYCKYITGLFYLLIFIVLQCLMILFFGQLYHFGAEPQLHLFIRHFASTFLVSAALLGFQQILSLLSANQILPLVVGIAGSFLGLFSMFFPPHIARLVLWGYYSLLCPIESYWDEAARISYYFENPFPTALFLGVLLLSICIFLAGRTIITKKEV